MKKSSASLVALSFALVLSACSDEGNETQPEPVERGIRNQEMTDQGQERDIISPAMDTDSTTDDRADMPEETGESPEENSYLPGAEDPTEMMEPGPQDPDNLNN